MFNLNHRTGVWAGVLLTVLAGVVIGCGGGGSTTTTDTTGLNTTTGVTTTTNTTGVTTTTTGNGVLPANVIFYADQPGSGVTTNYNYVTPAGTGVTPVASLSSNFGGICLNAVNQTKFFTYTADTSNVSYGVYSNTTFNIAGAKTIVAPNAANPYLLAEQISISPDGTTLYFLAAQGQNEPQIFSVPVAGGTPTALDFCLDSYNLNQAGNQLVYGKLVNNVTQIFTRGIASTSTPSQITNNSFPSDEPQWSKAGTKIAFSASPPVANGLDFLFVMNPDGSGVTQVTDTPNQDDHTPSFNTAATQLSFMSISGASESTQGLYTVSLGGAADLNRTEILPDPTILTGTYWTGTNGRGVGGKGWGFLNYWRKYHKAPPSVTAASKKDVK